MKLIEQSQYLQALGLFTMARMHAERATDFQRELQSLLGLPDLGHVGDLIWSSASAGSKEFDEAMTCEGFNVEAHSL